MFKYVFRAVVGMGFHPKVESILENHRKRVSEASVDDLPKASFPKRSFSKALAEKPFSLITEIKPSSPSKGIIRNVGNIGEIASQMEQAGANALSILTEKTQFNGSPANLTEAKK